MDEEAKNRVCAMRTGIICATGTLRPMLKERNKLKGKSIPNMIEGGRV
jgi:hypothetical protein